MPEHSLVIIVNFFGPVMYILVQFGSKCIGTSIAPLPVDYEYFMTMLVTVSHNLADKVTNKQAR